MKLTLFVTLLILSLNAFASVRILIQTSRGDIGLELNEKLAPISVKNFLAYLATGYYDGTIFHRTVPGFVIQAGGILPDMTQKPGFEPIKNEATNGLSNLRGTISMARTSDIDSATSHFFINTVDNLRLDHRPGEPTKYGYAVFGQVTSGMEVVDEIQNVPTHTEGPYENTPVEKVIIFSIREII